MSLNPGSPNIHPLQHGMREAYLGSTDPYTQMNSLRDYVNTHLVGFELYLEDVWNDHQPGETWFEYILRSKITLNETPPLAFDIYKNHQDAKGVWHLDDYQETRIVFEGPDSLWPFIEANQGDR